MDFPRDIFGPLSEEVVGLIKGLTKTDPSERLSCADALSHTWLAVGAQQTEALPEAAREAAQANRRMSITRRLSRDHEMGMDAAAAAAMAAMLVVQEGADEGGGGE